MMELFIKILIGAAVVIGTVIVMALLTGWLLSICWNATLPALFHFPEIDWWMGTKVMFLAGLLFKSGSSS